MLILGSPTAVRAAGLGDNRKLGVGSVVVVIDDDIRGIGGIGGGGIESSVSAGIFTRVRLLLLVEDGDVYCPSLELNAA